MFSFSNLKRLLVLLLVVMKDSEAATTCAAYENYCRDCSDSGLRSVPQDLPSTIKRLYLNKNAIVSLRQSDFSRYKQLEWIDLDDNDITVIQNGTFTNLPQLATLSLNYNAITDIKRVTSSNLSQLKNMYLAENGIANIQRDSFLNLPLLSILFLQYNEITIIKHGTFSNLRQLEWLYLFKNKISNIQRGSFLKLPKLSEVYLAYNQINHIEPGTFSNLLNLRLLNLESNKISIVQNGTFSNLPKLATLLLSNNQITVLSEYTDELMSIANVYLKNNPWQCDCRMVSFRQKMVGKWFEDHIICEEPSRLFGQKLKDIDPDDLICDEPQIVTFKMINGNRPVLEGETVILNCDVSGIPTPDITVTLPSGRNATVESGGRVTVEANGIITIENITATDSGLYVCLAASSGGSTSANLSIYGLQGPSCVSSASIYVQGPSSVSPTSIHVQGPSSVSPSKSFSFIHVSDKANVYLYGGIAAAVAFLTCYILAVMYHKRRIKKQLPLASVSSAIFNNVGTVVTLPNSNYGLEGQGVHFSIGTSRLGYRIAKSSENLDGQGMSSTQGTVALSGENIYENDDEAGLTVDSVYENDNEVEQGGHESVHLYGNEDEPVATVSGLQTNICENDNEVEQGGTAPVNVYENDNELEEGGTTPVNVYENDNEVEEGGTTPVNVYENDNEVEEGSTVSPDPVSELHGNEYENDDEDVASIHSVAVQHSYVYENNDDVFIESVVQEQTDVHENRNEELASTFVLENNRGKMMCDDVEEGTGVDEYDSDDEKAKFASCKSVYGNDNRKAASTDVQLLYKNTKAVEGTSQLIYGKEKDETATAVSVYEATNVDMDND